MQADDRYYNDVLAETSGYIRTDVDGDDFADVMI
jgi:hypothetical protein